MIGFRRRLLVLLASVGLLAPTRATSPRVTLRLDHATCEEAALSLSRATGLPIEVVPWSRSDIPGAVDPPLAGLSEPAQFVWNDVSLAQAMRELGERYSLRPSPRFGGGYRLLQLPLEGSRPRYGALPQTEVRGMRIQAQSVSVSGSYPGQAPGEQLTVKLRGQALSGDAGAVVGLEDVIARDDRGGLLVANNPGVLADHGYPDDWSALVSLTGLQPNGTGVLSVECRRRLPGGGGQHGGWKRSL